jgi:hypothetical protein
LDALARINIHPIPATLNSTKPIHINILVSKQPANQSSLVLSLDRGHRSANLVMGIQPNRIIRSLQVMPYLANRQATVFQVTDRHLGQLANHCSGDKPLAHNFC